MKRLPHLEVILPIYNEEENIPILIERLDQVAFKLRDEARMTYLFVNDGSTDESLTRLRELFEERSDIRIVNLVHNFGHGSALAAGIKYFDADAAVVMDADFQDNPDAIIQLFQEWKKGETTVVAERGLRSEPLKPLFSAFYFLLHRTTKTIPAVPYGTFSLLDRSVVERMLAYEERVRYFPGLVALASKNIKAVKVDRGKRINGQSRVGMFGLAHLAVTALISFSSTPIRVVSLIGLLCSIAGFLSGIVFIYIKIFTPHAIPGWASLMTAIAIASGMQLLCTGIIGEYIARIYDEVKQRPLYLVSELMEKSGRERASVLKSPQEAETTLPV